MKNDASKFLLEIEKATQELINTDKLHNLLVWTKYRADGSVGDIQPVGKRAIALAYANAKAYALTYANAYALANAYAYAYVYAYANAYAYAKNALKYFIRYTYWSKRFQIYQDVNYDKLINSLEILQEQIPEKGAEKEVYQAFGKQMIDVWLKAFKLKPEMVDLSRQEIKALDNYFYANLLLVECEQAAVRVSRRTWSEIESLMLMPFREQT